MTIELEDWKITAYALGELEGAERADVERRVAGDAGLAARVEAARRRGDSLRTRLAAEPGPGLSAEQRERLARAGAAGVAGAAGPTPAATDAAGGARPPSKLVRQLAWAAAACVVGGICYSIQIPRLYELSPSAPGTLLVTREARSVDTGTAGVERAQARVQLAGLPILGAMPGPAPVPPAGVLAPTTRDRADATPDMVRRLQEVEGEFHTEAYSRIVENAFHSVHEHPLSTFSIDVDTASYANVRRYLTGSMLPPPDAVRLEEMVNYFTYDYAPPSDKAHPFAVHMEVAACPWKSGHKLLRVGLKGRELDLDHRPPSNLVFLLDVSGSMNEPNKLPLLKSGIQLLVNQLGENDRVAIVVYAGASGLVLPSTTGDKKQEILAAIERLHAGGSTNGGAGIQLAYEVAREHFLQGGTNRVILATDGDFNVGVTSQGELVRTIEDKAKSGVFLSVLGFGMGNYKDDTLEKLADKGNGNYAYVDSLREARKVLVEQMAGTLVTIAKDVKIQIEFNPAQVSSYRLIGYENRILAKEDFNDDKKDAGEIGAGHTVTALYELVTAGGAAPEGGAPAVDPLKYQQAPAASPAAGASGELCTVKLRYKQPEGDASTLMTYPLRGAGGEFDKASTDFRFAAAVAGYGMLLRRSEFAAGFSWDAVVEIAGSSLGADREGYRKEFLDLARKAKALASQK